MMFKFFHKIIPIFTLFLIFLLKFGTPSWDELSSKIHSLAKTRPKYIDRTTDHYATSIPALHKLIQDEHRVFQLLKNVYLPKTKAGSALQKDIARYVQSYEKEVYEGLKAWRRSTKRLLSRLMISEHPLMIFQMLRRTVYELPKLYKNMTRHFKKVKSIIKFNEAFWPSQFEATDFAKFIVAMQYVYNFNATEFATGNFREIKTGVRLSARNCIELNTVALRTFCFSTAVQFMAAALDTVKTTKEFDDKMIRSIFTYTIKKHDNALNLRNQSGNQAVYTSRIGFISNYTKNLLKFELRQAKLRRWGRESYEEGVDETSDETLMQNHMTLCNGENWKTEDEKRQLTCWYENKKVPISPFKMELLSKLPFILRVHEFVTPDESLRLIDFAYDNLQLASEQLSNRASMVAWVFSKKFQDPDFLRRLNLRMEHVTGLKVHGRDNGEKLQIASNMVGGHFAPHNDSLGYDYKKEGELRVATFMIYLNKVGFGGRTSFPRAGIAVDPEPGSAIFWYNHYRNGTLNTQTYHGGCPVVYGQKWGRGGHKMDSWDREFTQLQMQFEPSELKRWIDNYGINPTTI